MMKLSHEVYGDATERMKRALDAHYRIDTASGCWLWTASLDRDGYGRFGPRVTKLAHRASWMLHFGPIPDGMLVCHSCDVLHADPTLYRRCVNPGHLWLGTPADNGADMAAKGRARAPGGEAHYLRRNPSLAPIGIKHGMAKLTDDAVREIRKMRACGSSQRVIAAHIGVSRSAVGHVLTGARWAHVA